jgi:hypothetical protein
MARQSGGDLAPGRNISPRWPTSPDVTTIRFPDGRAVLLHLPSIFPLAERRQPPERRLALAVERVAELLEWQLGLRGSLARGAALLALVALFFGRSGGEERLDQREA